MGTIDCRFSMRLIYPISLSQNTPLFYIHPPLLSHLCFYNQQYSSLLFGIIVAVPVNRNHGYNNSGAISDNKHSGHLLSSTHHHHKSTKYSSDGSYGYSPSPSRQATPHTGQAGHDEDDHHGVPSVPKFGDWDESDPKSAEGFTSIFERVKEKKGSLLAAPNDLNNYPDKQKNNTYAFFKSKFSCCLLPVADD